MSQISFSVIDTIGKEHHIKTYLHSYPSLMELIVNELLEDIGDCRGRAWCGTCIVRQLKGKPLTLIENDEATLLETYPNETNSLVRLSCQIEISPDLNESTWLVVDSRLAI